MGFFSARALFIVLGGFFFAGCSGSLSNIISIIYIEKGRQYIYICGKGRQTGAGGWGEGTDKVEGLNRKLHRGGGVAGRRGGAKPNTTLSRSFHLFNLCLSPKWH